MKQIILLIFVLSSHSFSQFTKNDSQLVQTTFSREFNKQIINNYFASKDSEKINAALLAISHSEDTSFVESIKQINFAKHYKFITFALGQLGASQNSTKYLLNKFISGEEKDIRYKCLESLGKIGDSLTLSFLIDEYYNSSGEGFDGITIAIYNFKIRGIEDFRNASVLLNELSNDSFDYKRKEDAVFTLLRAGADSTHVNILSKLFEHSEEHSLFFEQYSLGVFRKFKYFPNSIELLNKYIESENWLLRNEISKTGIYFPFKYVNQLEKYFRLMNDTNQNVQIQFAISLRDINFSESQLKEYLRTKIIETLLSEKISKQAFGELFITFTRLYSSEAIDYYLKYNSELNFEFVCLLLHQYHQRLNISSDSLITIFPQKSEIEKFYLIQLLLTISETKMDLNLTNFFLEQIEKGSPAVIGTIAAGINDSFVRSNSSLLKDIILKVINWRMHDCDFTETILSMHELSVKISVNFAKECAELISSSTVYALRKKFSKNISTIANLKNDDYFKTLFDNAFKYEYAIIKTEKGNIKIKFKPEYAPISTGSFIYLTTLNTFSNNIWHRVVPGFVIQGGDPSKTGWGGPGYDIISEFSPINFDIGMVGMASAGKDTEGSQFFVMQAEHPHLNGRYTIFAEVVEGLSTVYNLTQNDLILNIVLE